MWCVLTILGSVFISTDEHRHYQWLFSGIEVSKLEIFFSQQAGTRNPGEGQAVVNHYDVVCWSLAVEGGG